MAYWDIYPQRQTVGERVRAAEKATAKHTKGGRMLDPISDVSGNKLAKTFWGRSWCDNLERYHDYANRLPRGRSYVRSGSVIHLALAPGRIEALVSGSRVYTVEITIARVTETRWRDIARDCAGSIGSLVSLLGGKLDERVMERLCQEETGLFPAPSEIQLSCSCPDHATMCKHVAAVMYGVGVRLDTRPELLFELRGTSPADLIVDSTPRPTEVRSRRALESDDLAGLFGVELDEAPVERATKKASAAKKKPSAATKKTSAAKKPSAAKKKASAAQKPSAAKKASVAKKPSAAKKTSPAKKTSAARKTSIAKKGSKPLALKKAAAVKAAAAKRVAATTQPESALPFVWRVVVRPTPKVPRGRSPSR